MTVATDTRRRLASPAIFPWRDSSSRDDHRVRSRIWSGSRRNSDGSAGKRHRVCREDLGNRGSASNIVVRWQAVDGR